MISQFLNPYMFLCKPEMEGVAVCLADINSYKYICMYLYMYENTQHKIECGYIYACTNVCLCAYFFYRRPRNLNSLYI